MDAIKLLLYTRKGCCLCESLEGKLKLITFEDLSPPLDLFIIDIDSKEVSFKEKARYDLEVPILAIYFKESGRKIELPRVSPRLKEEALLNWLQKKLTESLNYKK